MCQGPGGDRNQALFEVSVPRFAGRCPDPAAPKVRPRVCVGLGAGQAVVTRVGRVSVREWRCLSCLGQAGVGPCQPCPGWEVERAGFCS